MKFMKLAKASLITFISDEHLYQILYFKADLKLKS